MNAALTSTSEATSAPPLARAVPATAVKAASSPAMSGVRQTPLKTFIASKCPPQTKADAPGDLGRREEGDASRELAVRSVKEILADRDGRQALGHPPFPADVGTGV